MKLHTMGINVRHEDTFFIDRPTGSGDNLLLIFLTPTRIEVQKSFRKIAYGSFILYRKGTCQRYGAFNCEYANHYFHFECNDETIFDELGLLTDTPGYLNNIEELETLLRLLSREQITDSSYRNDNEDLLINLILRKIAENQKTDEPDRKDTKHLEELIRIRSEIYSTPGKYKSIREMAEDVNLSISYFQAIYSEYFSVSCYEDLLCARILSGKEYLRNTQLTVAEIANLCGYDSDTCFMRVFKKREGITPTEYRIIHQKN